MKFQTILRVQLVVAGLAVAFLLPSSSRAQEITNTDFSDGPYVVGFAQPVPVQAAAAQDSAVTNSQTLLPLAAISVSTVEQQATLAQSPSVELWITRILMVGVGMMVLYILSEIYTLAEMKRTTRNLSARSNPHISTPTA